MFVAQFPIGREPHANCCCCCCDERDGGKPKKKVSHEVGLMLPGSAALFRSALVQIKFALRMLIQVDH